MADQIKLVSLENLQYFGGKVNEKLATKVDKVDGKALSTNDFDNDFKSKLEGIEAGAQVNTVTGVKGSAEGEYRVGNISISATDLGLSKVENKTASEILDEIDDSLIMSKLGYTPVDMALVGATNGVATLDEAGKVPAAQLPSYVDDVVEASNKESLPETGETGKIYVTLDDNLTYRWSGTAYVEISQSLALGETSATAFDGLRGKAAYDHSLVVEGNPHNVTKADLGIENVENKNSETIRAELTKDNVTTALGYTPVDGAEFTPVTEEKNGLMTKEDKAKLNSVEVPTKAEMEAAIDAIFA